MALMTTKKKANKAYEVICSGHSKSCAMIQKDALKLYESMMDTKDKEPVSFEALRTIVLIILQAQEGERKALHAIAQAPGDSKWTAL